MEGISVSFSKKYKSMFETARRLAEEAGEPLIQRTHLWRAIQKLSPGLFRKLLGTRRLTYGEWLGTSAPPGKPTPKEVFISAPVYRVLSLTNGGGVGEILASTSGTVVDLPHVAAALILDPHWQNPIHELLLLNGINPETVRSSVLKAVERLQCKKAANIEREAEYKVTRIRKRLEAAIVGQDRAIDALCAALLDTWRLPLARRKKPVSIFICGARGSGKSELVACLMAAIAEVEKLDCPGLTLNASFFSTEQTADDLVGHDENWKHPGPGKLTKPIQDKPQLPICIENVELTHARSQSLLCEAMEGSLHDAHLGKDVDFRQSVLIFTTSAGGDRLSDAACNGEENLDDRQRLADWLCDGIESEEARQAVRVFSGAATVAVAMRPLDADGLRKLTAKSVARALDGIRPSFKRIDCDKGALADVLVQALPSFDPRAIPPLVASVTEKLRIRSNATCGKQNRPRYARITVESGTPFDAERLRKNLHARRKLDFRVELATQPDERTLEVKVKPGGYTLLPDVRDGFIRISPPDGDGTSFDDLVGVSVVLESARRWKAYFEEKTTVKPECLAFSGAPGTGKTASARAMARYLRVPFCVLDGKDLTSGPDAIVSTFATIRRYAKGGGMLVFIDEIDSIGRVREASGDAGSILLTTLLAELDGFYSNSKICVVCATNRLEALDPALLRAGRFGKTIHFAPLVPDERLKLIEKAAAEYGVRITEELKPFVIASTGSIRPAEIKAVIRELALSGACVPTRDDYIRARQSILEGECTQMPVLTLEEKTAVAVHECGHALLCHLYGRTFTQVSIQANSFRLGFLEEQRSGLQHHTSDGLLKTIDIALAGRTADEVLGHPFDGAVSDLRMATEICLDYVKSGFSEYGLAVPDCDMEWMEVSNIVRPILARRHEHVRRVLEKERETLVTLSNLLLERGVLFQDDFQAVCSKTKSVRNVCHHE